MSLRSSKAKFVFITALAMAIGVGVSGCGSDDDDDGGGGGADCSACPASAMADCTSAASDCAMQGGTAAQCQEGVDLLCQLAGSLGDGGITIGDSGAPPPTGDGG